MSPIDKECSCYTCKNFTVSYLHHLIISGELIALQLLTTHNIYFMNELMSYIRKAILNDNLEEAELNWYK